MLLSEFILEILKMILKYFIAIVILFDFYNSNAIIVKILEIIFNNNTGWQTTILLLTFAIIFTINHSLKIIYEYKEKYEKE